MMESVCRVCLADDRRTYGVKNTALEQTYDVIIGVKLQLAGRPTALCCVCVSQLRRCCTFVETARESNAALDRWYRTHPRTDGKLSKQPLICLAKTNPEFFDIWEPQVKQEPSENDDLDQDDAGSLITDNLKQEALHGDNQNDPLDVSCEVNVKTNTYSDDDQANTQKSDDNQDNTQISLVKQDTIQMSCDDDDKTKERCGVKRPISDILDNVEWDSAHGTLKFVRNQTLLDQDMGSRSLRTGKRIKLSQDMADSDGPALKQRRPTTARHCPVSTDTASQCTPTTASIIDLKQHLIKRNRKKLFDCHKCNYRCTNRDNLKQHLLLHTGEKPFVCDSCHYRCNQKDKLKIHLKTCTGEKLYACNSCDYRSSRKDNLKLHCMTHNGKKPFACGSCDYRCIQKSTLTRHLMTHTREKTLACGYCDFRCNGRGYLKIHLMTHIEEKPFACDKCDYRCTGKDDLERHFKTHTGEKTFACDKCIYKCIQKEQLKRHLMTHTGEKTFACDKCDYRFDSYW